MRTDDLDSPEFDGKCLISFANTHLRPHTERFRDSESKPCEAIFYDHHPDRFLPDQVEEWMQIASFFV